MADSLIFLLGWRLAAKAVAELVEVAGAWSLAAAEDALLAGALVGRAEADEQPGLLVLLLLLQAAVRLTTLHHRLPPRL